MKGEKDEGNDDKVEAKVAVPVAKDDVAEDQQHKSETIDQVASIIDENGLNAQSDTPTDVN